MPKINVYLPDDLAEAVKESGVPVSAICQRALEQSTRRVSAIRAVSVGDLEDGATSGSLGQFTKQTHAAMRIAIERARTDGAAALGTDYLLHGLLAQGDNLALTVLRTMAIEPEQVARELEKALTHTELGQVDRLTGPAANALELAVVEAITLGHNYVGLAHVLLGLIAEPAGHGGEVLRALGADPRSTRAAVVAALTSHLHEATAQPPAITGDLRPLVARLERLEKHLGLTAEH